MSDLDDKLREILKTPHQDSLGATVMSFPDSKLIAQIKQAFADELGMNQLLQDMTNMHANLQHEYARLLMTPTPKKKTYTADFSNGKLSKLMTGQEWLEKLIESMIGISIPESHVVTLGKILGAAKRAAGIDHE